MDLSEASLSPTKKDLKIPLLFKNIGREESSSIENIIPIEKKATYNPFHYPPCKLAPPFCKGTLVRLAHNLLYFVS